MILVTGGTGFIGRHLVRELMAQGKQVRCLLPEHRAESLPWPEPPEVVVGSVLDEEAIFRAMVGVHTVIHLENALWWGRPRDLERIELVGTRNIIAAARASRIGRIITISHLGAEPAAAYPLMRVKGILEELIRNSGLAYTIIRSGLVFGEDDAFFNHIAMILRSNPVFFLIPGRGESLVHPIYVDDLVKALMYTLETPDTVDAVLELGGPEYLTIEDLVRTIMRVSGAPRVLISVPPYVLRWVTGISTRLLPRSLVTIQWLDILATNRTAQLGNAFTYFGLRPRRFEDTLVTYMRGKRYLLPMIRYLVRRRPRGA